MLRLGNAANKHELSLTPIKEIWAGYFARAENPLPVYITYTNDLIDECGSDCSSELLTDVEQVWLAPGAKKWSAT